MSSLYTLLLPFLPMLLSLFDPSLFHSLLNFQPSNTFYSTLFHFLPTLSILFCSILFLSLLLYFLQNISLKMKKI